MATCYVPSFKERKTERSRMADDIRRQQPDKIPVIIERYDGERGLPLLDKCKYLVPGHVTVAELMCIIRSRLHLHPEQALFVLANEKSLVSNSMTIADIYNQEKEQDGFLYLVYASQPAFG
ncbi:putative gamma-aminobutyric acid receptor-associated protein [Aphelenchoides besseyi]|nr:putative gamma-aminobutyric acid receptor-associated protein [Aphelenchoides besseyi]